MTSRERLLTAMRGGTPDRVPVAPFGWGRVDPDSPVGCALLAKTDPFLTAGIGGDPFLGRNAPLETRQDGDTTLTVLHTPAGDLTQRHRRTDITAATVEFFCKDARDVEKLLALPYEPPALDLSGWLSWRERAGEEALVMADVGNAVCFAANVLAPEDFSLLWADAPDVMTELTRVGAERLNAMIARACREGVDAFRIVGGEYVTVQLGPAAFRALIQPFDTRLCEILHAHGALAYYHNHGPIMRWLEPLADLGIDALDPVEAPPWGDCDLAEARRRLGNRVCMVGNLDDMEVLEAWDADAVQELGRQRLAAAGRTGFILGGTASGTYTEKAARNFLALAEMAAEGA